MALKESYLRVLELLPSIRDPEQKQSLRTRLKWTGLILILFFIMGQTFVYGVDPGSAQQLRFLEILLGSSFGSLMSLGIGPVVTASIILQLLVGSKIIPINVTSPDGRRLFQGTQKLLAILLSFIEGAVYVLFGAVPASDPSFVWLVILQLAAGGIIVVYMDEIIQKWGFGSGISLFIVAGVAKTIIVRTFNPLTQAGGFPGPGNPPSGIIPFMITTIIEGQPLQALFAALPLLATIIVFLIAVYANEIKVEVPLAYGNLRGFGRRWPLKFLYTSNIPVILIAALLANILLFGRMMANSGQEWIGQFDANGNPIGGLIYLLTPPSTIEVTGVMITIGLFALLGAFVANTIKQSALKITAGFGVLGIVVWYALIFSLNLSSLAVIPLIDFARLGLYAAVLIGGSMLFSYFWMTTAGMDPKSVANQIDNIGMQIPGYRRDVRIIEGVLQRYIPALTILGGAAIGMLASYADFTNAIGTGTGILLAALIIYQFYEQLAAQQLEDLNPALRKFLGQ
ncbi:MAG: preprotein translocase subunit SecY [Nanoarchaeota archaeon]|nr:preprotein translocase subunit SecY [Nanoarchaeota archaeon]